VSGISNRLAAGETDTANEEEQGDVIELHFGLTNAIGSSRASGVDIPAERPHVTSPTGRRLQKAELTTSACNPEI
jgi:hypothetical protein